MRLPAILNLFQGSQEKIKLMFAEIQEESITICKKKVTVKMSCWNKKTVNWTNRLKNSKIESMTMTPMNGKTPSFISGKAIPPVDKIYVAGFFSLFSLCVKYPPLHLTLMTRNIFFLTWFLLSVIFKPSYSLLLISFTLFTFPSASCWTFLYTFTGFLAIF